MSMPEWHRCTSCDRLLFPGERSVEFSCPACGSVTIIRCEKCRINVNMYKCPNCGFEGP